MRLLAMFLLAGLWSCEQRIPGGAMMDAMVTVDGRCLGVLVSSELVLYPGHCGSKTEYIGTVVGKLSTEACWVHQEGMLGNGTDFAACRLSASVSVPAANSSASRYMIGYTGTSSISINQILNMTVIAPRSALVLEPGKTWNGSGMAKNIEIHQGAYVHHRPFLASYYSTLCP